MRKVLLVSLDAFFEPDVETLPPDGAIAGILKQGAFCRRVTTVFPALTYPVHVTMVTGCDPEKSGIGQNEPFQPDTAPDARRWYCERKHIRVSTLFDQVRLAGGRSCAILWPVTCRDTSVRWNFSEIHPLPGESTALSALWNGSPLYVLLAELRFGRLRKGTAEPYLSDFAAALAADTIRRHQPDLTALHLIDLDATRHHYGTFSPESRESIHRLDRRIADLLRAVQETPGMEDALVILVSDHGQDDIRRTVDLRETLDRLLPGFPLRPQSNGMSACFFASDGAVDVNPLIPLLEEHREALGISHIYSREELDRLHAVPEPVLAVEAAEGVAFSDGLEEEKREKATHGFGPGRKGCNCLFAVYGRGIRRGVELPSMSMRDVGPTVAGLMGISLPDAQGVDRSADFLA